VAIRYESGSTYFPGYETSESVIEYLEAPEVARRSLKNRREIILLEDPTVLKMASVLAERVRKPDVWIRSAVTTLDRFSREVCDGDLSQALAAGQEDPFTAEVLLQKYLYLHQDLTSIQTAALLFGPKLWWTINNVQIPWSSRYLTSPKFHIANSKNGDFNPTTRLLMLSLLGTGLTFEEVASIKVKDAGSLDSDGRLVPNIESDPLAMEYDTSEGRRITFLGEEARSSLVTLIKERAPKAEDPLFAKWEDFENFKNKADIRGKALIETVNDVNVTLCKTVGDFFLEWGIPGRNFYKENGLPTPE
jgi:hypothetical protein